MESEEDLLAQVIAAAEVGLPGICDRVYQNMVCRYHVCVKVAGRHIVTFLLLIYFTSGKNAPDGSYEGEYVLSCKNG